MKKGWERVSGLTVPSWLGHKPEEGVPDTVVKIRIEVSGGGLPGGETAVIDVEPLKLRTMEALTIDVLAEERDPLADDSWRIDSRPRRVELHLVDGILADDGSGVAFTVTTSDGGSTRG